MTIELAIAIVSLLGAALTAGKVIFSTEVKVERLGRDVESLNGKAQAMDALANEGKTAHFRLAAEHVALAEVVGTKASAESVANIKESLEHVREDGREIKAAIGELSRKIDLIRPTTPARKR